MNPAFLADQARALLQTLVPGQTLTSSQLLARLGVDTTTVSSETAAMFRVLRTLSDSSLADCSSRGGPYTNQFGKTIRPYLWHAPSAREEEPEVDPLDLDQLFGDLWEKICETNLRVERLHNEMVNLHQELVNRVEELGNRIIRGDL